MKIETTIRKMELTVEKTETLRISRTRRLVYERCSDHRQEAKDEGEFLDPTLMEIEGEPWLQQSEQS
jgi:hypothetical protein